MDFFITQIKHNEHFYDCVCVNYPDNFFDWKITIAFYIAVHYLKALATKQGVVLSSSHFDVEKQVNPDKRNELGLIRHAWDWYYNLYLASRSARYSGFTSDHKTYMATKEADFRHCEKCLRKFKNYMKSKGIDPASNP